MPLRLIVSTKPPRQLAISLDRPVLNGMTSRTATPPFGAWPVC